MLPGDVRHHVVGRGEGNQTVVVIVFVAECYQALVLRAVVPAQVAGGHGKRDAVVKDALQVVHVGRLLVRAAHGKETGWGHLLGVANDDGRPCTCQGAYGLAGGHLACLVEDHQVELGCIHVEVLRHAQRTHQHHRAQAGHQVRHLVDDAAYACTAPLAGNALAQQGQFAAQHGIACIKRDSCRNPGHQFLACQLLEITHKQGIAADKVFEHQSVKLLQCGVGTDNLLCLALVVGSHKTVAYSIHGHSSGILLHCLGQTASLQVVQHIGIALPLGQEVHIAAPSLHGCGKSLYVVKQRGIHLGHGHKLLPFIVALQILACGACHVAYLLVARHLLLHAGNGLRQCGQVPVHRVGRQER